MTLAQFVPFLPEIFLAAAGFAVLLLGIPLNRWNQLLFPFQPKPPPLPQPKPPR